MGLKTVPNKDIEKQADDLFEATVVASQRARQIVGERHALREVKDYDEEPGLLEELPEPDENYVEEEKATTVALDEFLEGELKWKYSSDEEEDEEK